MDLRIFYSNLDGLTRRVFLVLLVDAIYVFRDGKPIESFAHANSNFELEKLMEETSIIWDRVSFLSSILGYSLNFIHRIS